MKKVNVVIVYSSRHGHTRLMAEAVARGAAEAGAEAKLMTAGEAAGALDQLDRADAIVIGSPTYMGNLSSEIKQFMEKSVSRWFSRAWQDKIAGGFTCSGNFYGDKGNTLNGLLVFAMQLGMIWVGEGEVAASNVPDSMKHLNGPGVAAVNRCGASIGPMGASFDLAAGDAPGPGDLATCENYGRRIAGVAAKFFRE